MITLRPHQQQIINLGSYDRGQVIVPTGGGKTMVYDYGHQESSRFINNGCD